VTLLDKQQYNNNLYLQGLVCELTTGSNTGNIYSINNRFKENIIGNIKIGISKNLLLSELGKPISDNGVFQLYIIGDIYIGFYGNTNIDYVIVKKVILPKYNQNILGDIINDLDNGVLLKDVYNKHKDYFQERIG
jgi:hypothetical protein